MRTDKNEGQELDLGIRATSLRFQGKDCARIVTKSLGEYIGVKLGLLGQWIRQNGNYYSTLALFLYCDIGEENVNCYSILGLRWDNGKNMKTSIVHWGCIGIMEKKMETTKVHWG